MKAREILRKNHWIAGDLEYFNPSHREKTILLPFCFDGLSCPHKCWARTDMNFAPLHCPWSLARRRK